MKTSCTKTVEHKMELIPGLVIPVYGVQDLDYDRVTGEVYDSAGIKRESLKQLLPYCPYMFYCYAVESKQRIVSRTKTADHELLPYQVQRYQILDYIADVREYKTKRMIDATLSVGDFRAMTLRICQTWKDAYFDKLAMSKVLTTSIPLKRRGMPVTQRSQLEDWFDAWYGICSKDTKWHLTNMAMCSNWMKTVWDWYEEYGVETQDEQPAVEVVDTSAPDHLAALEKLFLSQATTEEKDEPPAQGADNEAHQVLSGTVIKDWSAHDEMIGPRVIHEIEPTLSMEFQFTFNWNFMRDVVKLTDMEYSDMVTKVEYTSDGCTVRMTLEYKNIRPVDPRCPEAAAPKQHDAVDLLTKRATEYYMLLNKCAMSIAETREAVARTNVVEGPKE